MKAKYLGRYIQVEKHHEATVLIDGKVVVRRIYKDEDGRRFIKRRDGSLVQVVSKIGDNMVLCNWHHNYELV